MRDETFFYQGPDWVEFTEKMVSSIEPEFTTKLNTEMYQDIFQRFKQCYWMKKDLIYLCSKKLKLPRAFFTGLFFQQKITGLKLIKLILQYVTWSRP